MASAAATAATVEGSDRAHVQYRSHLQTYGWQNWKNEEIFPEQQVKQSD